MATFMYYPGHIAAASCGSRNLDTMIQHHHSYSADPASHRGNPYGYYAAPPPPPSLQRPFYNQPVLPPVNAGHHRHHSSYMQGGLPPLNSYYNQAPAPAQAPILPPPAVQEPVREEYVNGGVNQHLDYDLDMMADFVVKNAYISFGCDLHTDATQSMDLFVKGVTSVLNATRLPSVTIFLALDLLSKYIDRLPEDDEKVSKSINVIYQNTMVAFVIANKFNDDKTFTNRSWTQATGMSLSSINGYERDWLNVFEWRLFDDKFVSYEDYLQTFEVFCQEKRCPSPPNLLPTPHSTDNYLSPPSGYQTPVQMTSSVYSSPCYYDEENNDFCYSQLPQGGMMSSPINSGYDNGYSTNQNNFNFYNYNPQINNRPWNMDDTFKHPPQPNFAALGNSYYRYSAVY